MPGPLAGKPSVFLVIRIAAAPRATAARTSPSSRHHRRLPISASRGIAARWPIWLTAAGLFACVHLVSLLAGLPRTTGRRLYGTIALAVLYYVAAWAFFRAARRTDLPARLRTALRLVGAGLGMIAAGATLPHGG